PFLPSSPMPHYIGIDLGSQALGIATIRPTLSGYELILCEAFHLPPVPLPERLSLIHHWLTDYLNQAASPSVVAIESPFVGRNVRSALTLGIVQGLLWGILIERGLSLYTLSPAEVKRALTGRAHASKEQVAAMLQHHLSFACPLPDSEHATDAAAIALAAAYYQNSPITRRLTKRAER
ncbi:MAG: crossover junction endodeoxyribonuclease RuvC, partial [Bacteroidia bacterium]|nr:crossover junction endodeoxyribonuclease RuvC [Bacteroidia bacterium]